MSSLKSIAKSAIVSSHVVLEGNYTIEDFAILGHILKNGQHSALIIGEDARIGSHSVVYLGSRIGPGFILGHGAIIQENARIGGNVQVGSHSVIERNVILENHVQIQSGVFISQYSHVKHHVWIGSNTAFSNNLGSLNTRDVHGPIIEPYVRIGANCTILNHIKIGPNAIVGAGSVVVNDIPPNSIVGGNPARIMKKIEELSGSDSDKKDILDGFVKSYFKI